MDERPDQLSDWVALLLWLERARSTCKELHAHLQLLLEVLSGDDTASDPLLPHDISLPVMGAMRQHLESLGWVVAHLGRLTHPRLDRASLDELADFDRAATAHLQAPVSLLLRATTEELSARMRVGTPPPDVFAALRWHTDHNGEWSIGSHLGTLPVALRRYYDELADVDEDHRRVFQDP